MNRDIYTIQHPGVLDDIERVGFYRPAPSTCMDADGYYGFRLCYRWMIDMLREKCGLPLGVNAEEYEALAKGDDEKFRRGWERIDDENGFVSIAMEPSDMPHPVWGFQKCFNRRSGKVDMRSWTTGEPEEVIRMQLSIPDERLLFSDLEYWHIPLNMGYFPGSDDWDAEDDAFDEKVKALGLGLNSAHELFSEKINHLYTQEENCQLAQLQHKFLDSWRNCLVDASALGSEDNPMPFRDTEWLKRETQCVFWEIRPEDIVSVEEFTTRKAARC